MYPKIAPNFGALTDSRPGRSVWALILFPRFGHGRLRRFINFFHCLMDGAGRFQLFVHNLVELVCKEAGFVSSATVMSKRSKVDFKE
jgi:hypothetical protein